MEEKVRYRRRADGGNLGKARLRQIFSSLEVGKDYQVAVSEWKDKRSLKQNALYWKWLTIIGNELGYYKDELHELFIDEFADVYTIRDWDGKPKQKRCRTSKMDITQMTQYLNRIDQFAAEHQIVLPTPDREMLRSFND